MKTLSDLIARNAFLHGDRPCFAGTHDITHRAHAQRCWRLANAWTGQGLQAGDRVAFLLRNRIEAMEVYGAAEAAGLVAVPLNWRLSAGELGGVLADCEPRAVVTGDEFADTLDQACAKAGIEPDRVLVDGPQASYEPLLAQGEPVRPGHRPRPEDLAYIIYTSGTTGRPKGAMWTQGAMLESSREIALATSSRTTDRIVISMPLFHIGARIEWLAVQVVGGSCVLLDSFREELFFRAVQDWGGNVAHLAPIMVNRLVAHESRPRFALGGLRRVQYGSAPVRGEDLRRAQEAFGPIFYQMYGMTEHMLNTVLCPWDVQLGDDPATHEVTLRRRDSAGQPYACSRIRIVDEQYQDVPAGSEGEIIVRSPAMMSGYFRAPELTAEAFVDGWLRTGDIGRFDESGFLYVVDRRKDMIVSGGENIYSREVEEALLAHPAVAEVAVIGVPDARWGEAVKALVVLAAGQTTLPEDEIMAICRDKLASYKKPGSFEVLESLPRLATGKVDKKLLRAPYWQAQARRV